MKKYIALVLCIMFLLIGCTMEVEAFSEPTNSDISYDWEIVKFHTETTEGYVRYGAVVKVVNTGDVNIKLGYWKLDIEDADGHLVYTIDSSNNFSAPSIIKPGETGYYFTLSMDEFNSTDSTEYKLVPHFDYMSATKEEPKEFAVEDVSFKQSEEDFPTVLGRVINDTDKGHTYGVYAIFYDGNGDIISISGTLDEVGANDKSSFMIEDYKAFGRADIANYEVNAFLYD